MGKRVKTDLTAEAGKADPNPGLKVVLLVEDQEIILPSEPPDDLCDLWGQLTSPGREQQRVAAEERALGEDEFMNEAHQLI